jgi:putative ABC transport system permease protein
MAHKYFGEKNPIGKTFVTNDGIIFTVTGVLKEIPENSHLKFDFLVSFQTIESINGKSLISENWLNNGYRTYLLLDGKTNLQEFDNKLRKYDIDGFNGKKWSFHLQPLADIHFNRQIRATGNKETLFIFITAGVFILFVQDSIM